MSTTPRLDLTIRPRRREDDERILEIFAQYEDAFLMTLESLRFHMDERVREPGMEPQSRVAESDGRVVGDSYLEPHGWTTEQGVFFTQIEVDRDLWGNGIGSRLWQDVEELLRERQARKVYTRIAEDMEHSRQFASARGFAPTGRAERYSRLDVAAANLEGYEGIEDALRARGIVIKPLSEVDYKDETFVRGLYDAATAAVRDIPSTEDFRPTPYEVWRQNFLKSPSSKPEAYFVAFHDGRPIGLANLSINSKTLAFNGLTGVMPEFRGMGVARGLKLRTIEWSRANGITHIHTSNDAENKRMLAINVRLGYQPLPAREEWLKEL